MHVSSSSWLESRPQSYSLAPQPVEPLGFRVALDDIEEPLRPLTLRAAA
jgi:hypothetical protein